MPTSERRFPPPWSIEELNNTCFVAIDSADQKLAYVYFEDRRGPALGFSCLRAESPAMRGF
jgi:hypothetical protein